MTPNRETKGSGLLSLPRAALGGILMGLANLVPGISGGTMLLATGVYPRFVEAVAQVTSLRWRLPSLFLLGTIGGFALLSIAGLAGPMKHLVQHHEWVMYSLFIGLTLGGVPLVWRLGRPASFSLFAGCAAGFAVMAATAVLKPEGSDGGGAALLFAAGVVGASAMVLPGISGAYMLLVLGVYERILGAVDRMRSETSESLAVLLPVAAGVLAGIAGVSHLLRFLLHRAPKFTYGLLLGLLLGSVLGIWPFATTEPTPGRAAAALALAAAGFAATLAVDALGRFFERG